SSFRLLFSGFLKIGFHRLQNKKEFLKTNVEFLQSIQLGLPRPQLTESKFEEQILLDGYELIELGFSPEKIQMVLEERIYQVEKKKAQISNSIQSLSKYPPAFGLAGTVFGLVELMKAVTEGLPAQQTGIKMATALVATMYGLIVANLFVNPAGELLKKIYEDENRLYEIALHTVMLAAEQSNLLEAQEMLNSHVEPHERVNVLQQTYENEGAA
ncbi:MAG: MotA/TolQ/ExbB proton channel family protein, partial [Bdellovibrionales bacterium]|nr:MotA/TolQ/ExbB proton channel family protein [Bdellovibrionales bacterium]